MIEPDYPRRYFPIARIVKLNYGQDGCARSTLVKTTTCEVTRPTVKVALVLSSSGVGGGCWNANVSENKKAYKPKDIYTQALMAVRPGDKSLSLVNQVRFLPFVGLKHIDRFFTVFWFLFSSALIKTARQNEQFVSRTLLPVLVASLPKHNYTQALKAVKHVERRGYSPIWPFYTVFLFKFGSALIITDRPKERNLSQGFFYRFLGQNFGVIWCYVWMIILFCR